MRAGGLAAVLWLSFAGCNAAFGIDDLEASGPSAVSGNTTTVSSTHATAAPASISAGAGGMGGAGGSSEGGMGGAPPSIKRVFVTSENTDGNLNGYSGGDAICQQLGGSLGPSLWRAWLSDGAHDAIFELTNDGPWFLVDGVTLVAANKAQLASGMLDHPIDQDENGQPVDETVWTGTKSDGKVAGGTNYHCNNWSTGATSIGGLLGLSASVDGDWTQAGQLNCGAGARLYCFEQ